MKRVYLREHHLGRFAKSGCKICFGLGRAAYVRGYPVLCRCVSKNPRYQRLKKRAETGVRVRRVAL